MMNFEVFTEKLLKEVRGKAAGTFRVRLNTVTKNNGINLTGISAAAEGSNGGPCIYLDDFYRDYVDGEMEFGKVADKIYGLLKKHLDDMRGIDLSGFLNWETVKGRIYAKLINAEQNKEQLEETPHRTFLDLAVVYYIVVDRLKNQGISTILIRNKYLEMWGQNEENLYQEAMLNMRSDGAPCFDSIETVIKHILPDAAGLWEDEGYQSDTGIYILTNQRKCYGASEILDRNTLRTVADKIGDRFIVLPSSLHEVIVLKPDNAAEYGKLADMVREVNVTQVSEEERLSDHVYVYRECEGMLKVAG